MRIFSGSFTANSFGTKCFPRRWEGVHRLQMRRVVLLFAPVCNIRVILSLTFVPRLSAPARFLPAAGPCARVPSRSFVHDHIFKPISSEVSSSEKTPFARIYLLYGPADLSVNCFPGVTVISCCRPWRVGTSQDRM